MQNTATSADTSAAKPAPAYDAALPKGKVTDSILCKDQSQSFALYLPSYYTTGRSFPCIYFFDPHAHGILPVSKYKDLAEKYGFIFIGCNTSKNGMQWQTTSEAIHALMADTRSTINIDPKRIYTAGFSGGSRVASTLAIQDGGVAGVIGCAAGFPGNGNPTSKFDYFGMVGNQDFNLTEMEQLDGMLQQNSFTHQLLVFDGKHGWAPFADFQTALLWMQVNAIKKNLQPQNDTLVAALKTDYDKRIATATSSHDLVKLHELLEGMVMVLDGVTDVSASKKHLADLAAGDDFKKAVALQTQIQQIELNQQQDLAQQFTTHDEKWWEQKIAELEQNARPKTLAAQMNRRLLNYMGLVSYMNSNHALQTGNLTNALTYLHIFKMADPQNADQPYLAAIYYTKKSDQQQAITSLREAAKLGYSDVEQLMTDPAFTNLQNDAVFKDILQQVKANTLK